MKVAIVSDVIADIGGAEKILQALLELYPEAHLYTLAVAKAAQPQLLRDHPQIKLTTSPLQLFAGNHIGKYFSIFKLVTWIYWLYLDLSEFDLVISSSHSFGSKAVRRRPGALHISYIHTTPRYLYQEFAEIGFIRRRPWSWLFAPLKAGLQWLDRYGASNPDVLVANSGTVRERIKKYYRRSATVIYPPVTPISRKTRLGDKYYLCFSRLVRQKGVELAVRTFNRIGKPLVVVGTGPERNRLQRLAHRNIRFWGECREIAKPKLFAKAKALIYPAVDEDFGIVPVEALSAGVPVIAYHSGGVRETIQEGRTGIFFKQYSEAALAQAITRFEAKRFIPAVCRRQAAKYLPARFKREFTALVKKELGRKISLSRAMIMGLNLVASPLNQFASQLLSDQNAQTIYCTTLNELELASRDPGFKRILRRGTFIVPDGMPLVWWLRWHGFPQAERIYGPELMQTIFDLTEDQPIRHVFVGANPRVMQSLRRRLQQLFPLLKPGPFYSPPYQDDFSLREVAVIVRKLRLKRQKNQFIWLALGADKQVAFAARLKDLGVKGKIVTVGAAFDFLAGTKPQAPRMIRRWGLEWLFRLFTEPQRLAPRYFRIITFLLRRAWTEVALV